MRRILGGFLCWTFLTLAGQASAADTPREAADRFDRGLRLFNEGDNAGALLEFKRAYELSGERSIMINVGLVYAELGRPVDAVETLDKALAQPAGIPAAQIERAQRVRDEQRTRIGRLLVTSNVPAQIEIDNLVVGRTPMAAPLAVASGLRLLGVVAPGHVPIRLEVSVTGGQQTDTTVELLPLQGALANLIVRCVLPGADVLVDGKLVGRTPLPASVPLPPGSHEVTLRRPGYRALAQNITLADGSTGEVTLEAAENNEEADLVGGLIGLEINQPDANVAIDSVPRSGFRAGLRLPAGPHRLNVTRVGFLPFDRELSVDKGLQKTVRIELQPTEETRTAHVRRVSAQRRNAWITMGAGALVGGAGTYLIFRARDDQRAADAEYAVVAPQLLSGQPCDKKNLPPASPELNACQAKVDHVNSMQDDAKRLKWIGWSTAGVGGAVFLTGVILRLIADDMDDIRVASTGNFQPYAWTSPAGGGMGLHGNF
ncbi:MAG TPA: PEGA domain-containing protein [Polyangia bacterium]|jgi:PEGA domain.|nr:PEGA domain-containing protein [Polyangia bacterium]